MMTSSVLWRKTTSDRHHNHPRENDLCGFRHNNPRESDALRPSYPVVNGALHLSYLRGNGVRRQSYLKAYVRRN